MLASPCKKFRQNLVQEMTQQQSGRELEWEAMGTLIYSHQKKNANKTEMISHNLCCRERVWLLIMLVISDLFKIQIKGKEKDILEFENVEQCQHDSQSSDTHHRTRTYQQITLMSRSIASRWCHLWPSMSSHRHKAVEKVTGHKAEQSVWESNSPIWSQNTMKSDGKYDNKKNTKS